MYFGFQMKLDGDSKKICNVKYQVTNKKRKLKFHIQFNINQKKGREHVCLNYKDLLNFLWKTQ